MIGTWIRGRKESKKTVVVVWIPVNRRIEIAPAARPTATVHQAQVYRRQHSSRHGGTRVWVHLRWVVAYIHGRAKSAPLSTQWVGGTLWNRSLGKYLVNFRPLHKVKRKQGLGLSPFLVLSPIHSTSPRRPLRRSARTAIHLAVRPDTPSPWVAESCVYAAFSWSQRLS